MYNDDGVKVCDRYTVVYEGFLFEGDNETGYNFHGTDSFEDAIALYYFYGDMIEIIDNEYCVRFAHGEWC